MNYTTDVGAHRAEFLELEYAASAAYNEFVYKDRAQADAVRGLLFDRGVAEFAPPHTHFLVEDGALAGFITRLSAGDLARCRMKSAYAIGKAGFFDQDPSLYDRMRIATQVLVPVRAGDTYLSRLAASRAFAGRGLAGRLMQHATEEARRVGDLRITFEVSTDNMPVYRMHSRQGYQEVDRRSATDPATGRTITFIHMAKAVPPAG